MIRFATLLISALVFLASCSTEPEPAGETRREARVTLRFNTDNIGELLEITRAMAVEFERETGIAVDFVIGPDSSTERLAQYQRHFQARSSDIDIYKLDVIWPGIFAQHLVDLSDVIDVEEHFDSIAGIWMVEGQLVAAPYYADAPLLYYRTDLLAENGYDAPPATWDELAAMAEKIQTSERAKGNTAFQGYVFQGAAYEGLTCNALEWQVASTGRSFLDADGSVFLDAPEVRELFEAWRVRVSRICPPGVMTYMEEDARHVFHQGNAAFMRNWPYALASGQLAESPIRGKFDVTALPAGDAQSASTLGGWGLGVSRHSRHIEEAKQFVAYLSRRESQRRRALEGSYLPTRPDVFADAQVRAARPYFPLMEGVLASVVTRPAVQAGRGYNEVSSAYYTTVHRILTGETPTERALAEGQERIERILSR